MLGMRPDGISRKTRPLRFAFFQDGRRQRAHALGNLKKPILGVLSAFMSSRYRFA